MFISNRNLLLCLIKILMNGERELKIACRRIIGYCSVFYCVHLLKNCFYTYQNQLNAANKRNET